MVVFNDQHIRRTMHNNEWWFVVHDIIRVLTNSTNPTIYTKAMRRRDSELSKGWVQIVSPLYIETTGGKQKLNCANTEGVFRLIQSIPSPKAEPFKLWLAKVGYERVQEIENPELAQKRIRATYLAKGYEPDWIEKRMQGIETRSALTDEWHDRGVKGEQNYAILTSEISKAAFGITPSDHKKLKGIKNHNLRDHMSRMELIFTELGEAATTEIAKTDDVYGMHGNKDAAHRGGSVAGTAREQLEKETGKKVITEQNFLPKSNDKKIK